jgi:hypothetical protein
MRDAGMKQAVLQRVDQLQAALAPWQAGRFLDFTERPGNTDRMWLEKAYRRLREIESRHDSDNIVRANHEPAELSSESLLRVTFARRGRRELVFSAAAIPGEAGGKGGSKWFLPCPRSHGMTPSSISMSGSRR